MTSTEETKNENLLIVDDKGHILYNPTHLFSEEMKTWEEVVRRYAGLDIRLFYHIVSSPHCYYEQFHGTGRIDSAFRSLSAKERFKRILEQKFITGNPKGYYVNKQRPGRNALGNDDIKSVSFGFASISEVPQHFSRRDSEYGICFFHDFLATAGAQPVVYINDLDDDNRQALLVNAPHLLEVFSAKYDMRWEREWRVFHQMKFSYSDIAFVIVPDASYSEFEYLWEEHEVGVIVASAFTDAVEFLRLYPVNRGFSQFKQRILGLKVVFPFDCLLHCTNSEHDLMLTSCGDAIDCFIKTVIQSHYEERYSSKFKRFLQAIDDPELSGLLSLLDKNLDEPLWSGRNLFNHCILKLYTVQAKRIEQGVVEN